MNAPLDVNAEWLEADGVGGYASGTVGGRRTRRYQALLLSATTPPTGRVVLVNGVEVWLVAADGSRFALSAQRYAPDVDHPDGNRRFAGFTGEPWPRWTFRCEDGTEVDQEFLVRPDPPETWLRWRVRGAAPGARLEVRLLMSGRDQHALHHANDAFAFTPEPVGAVWRWRPYPGLPIVEVAPFGAATYRHDPVWFRRFQYDAERARGLDDVEDLASPGLFSWDLDAGEAGLVLRALPAGSPSTPTAANTPDFPAEAARRRAASSKPGDRAAAEYLVRRGDGVTIVAGYPWFTDWGRDTFIALRGLCLARDRLDAAAAILRAWAGTVSEGMLPNRFPDHGETPEFNAVDASLWFVVAAHELALAAREAGRPLPASTLARLDAAVDAIVDGYRGGTRYRIGMAADGLVAAGTDGVQLTWMDARIGDRVVTPRIGKPVEIQALWINALAIAGRRRPELLPLQALATATFRLRFPDPTTGGLHDVVDADHVAGRVDPSFRPNQIFAVGGLPLALLEGTAARQVVEAVQASLLTPMGLRTLAPGEAQYRPRFEGGMTQRDEAYHQGSAWPWLIGPFVEAYLRTHADEPDAKATAKSFLAPLQAHRDGPGLGHVFEVTDGEAPHRPGGCPFQAWSLGELIRAERLVDGWPPPAVAGALPR